MCHSQIDQRVHTNSLTYGQSIIHIYAFMIGLGANFNVSEVASSDNSCANCQYDMTHSVLKTLYNSVFSIPDSSVSS